MADKSLWRIKSEGDLQHPETEPSPYLAGHGMDVEPVYIWPSNPINQACVHGRCLQVYHIKQDNVLMPVEANLNEILRNQSIVLDAADESQQHLPDRVERSAGWRVPFSQFSWADASVGTAKRILGWVGDNIYNLTNAPKPNGG